MSRTTYQIERTEDMHEGYQPWLDISRPTALEAKMKAEHVARYWCRRRRGSRYRVLDPEGEVVWAGRHHGGLVYDGKKGDDR